MTKNVLAFDLGASSGRGMLARFDGEKITLEEVHRFPHNFSMLNGHAYWNLLHLMDEMKNGLRKSGKDLSGVGFDTWGVDCGFLSREGDLLAMPGSYRDPGLDDANMREALIALHPNGQTGESTIGALEAAVLDGEKYAFGQTGIASLAYNTIYKLYYMKKHMPSILEQTDTILMMPNLIEYLFSGVKHTEYSIASTSQLYNMEQKCWAKPLLDKLQFDPGWFTEVDLAGRDLGTLRTDVAKETKQQDLHIISAPGHDTACAVAAVPAKEEQYPFLSSGTWSLMGIERKEADCSLRSMQANFTNEGGYDHRFRYLKNIMGLWMIQSVKKEFTEDLSFAEICERASKETITSLVDCNDDSFLAPKSMIEAVKKFCRDSKQQVPETVGEIAAVIYNSLAKCYGDTIEEIEALTGKKYTTIYVVGGGANAGYLNELTAKYTGKKVSAGPSEATAIGNIVVQMLHDGVFKDLPEARTCVGKSFDVKIYEKM